MNKEDIKRRHSGVVKILAAISGCYRGCSNLLKFAKVILLQILCPYLLDLRLPDLFGHPGRGAGWLFHLNALSMEYMRLLRASLKEADICDASVGRVQGCLPVRR